MSDDWAAGDDSRDEALFLISFVAEATGLHPQTLRQYDRLGLVSPSRARGRGRRCTARDVHNLRRVQQLTAEGVNLAGVKRILELEAELEQLRSLLATFNRIGYQREPEYGPEPENLPAVRLKAPTAVVRWFRTS